MKATIKIKVSERKTDNGLPVYLEIYHKGKRKREMITHSFLENWDIENQKPLKQHLDYGSSPIVVFRQKF
ncbi:hypothetical protein A8C32_02025 [Flavivirga aquatica]|uniref:Arm DNA-binding domain-containing protein n=1 Tax=Flavivirga aquatica TaxID=1849968 RepID=A0A1E5TA44_9FLAO|nr:Arm DNA-binding domain-containing protein [Flavivirga aquatica]OEK08260.1 hypothetical protein A8C32_02025 [Flavivirga aquatica]